MRTDTCKSCGAEMVWARHHSSGNKMPLVEADPQEHEGTFWRLEEEAGGTVYALPVSEKEARQEGLFGERYYISHFATCPEAESWRGRSRKEL